MSTKELAERLRAMGHERECDARTSAEAAAEIERLRAERDEARQAAAGCSAAYLASHRERDALRAENAGQTVRLSGWVFRKRDHGGILFVDLRDHYGQTQVVVHPSRSFFETLTHLKLESVVMFEGRVMMREPSTTS